ncbi:hypothetical protein Dsin_014923 [Dipteronia sinensis]|uniref:B-like cyclin n=1 Tax=Dipteronia sinensis TaxID=43782 RepID=A0AAE0ANA9_9ROSI|nr:hypothetical protein Dsin_014923 [Dipteronia sinensis]
MASIKGKLKMGINRVTDDSRSHGTVGGRNLKIYSEDEKLKLDANSTRNSVTVKKAAALTSASDTKVIAFSVLSFVSVNLIGVWVRLYGWCNCFSTYRCNCVYFIMKGTLDKMENNRKSKGVSSAYTKVGRKALADLLLLPQCRTSESISARVQNKVDAPSSKFSFKPNGKTASMDSNAKGTLKSKVQSGVNKPISVAAISSKKKKEDVRSSLPEDIVSMVSHEAAQGKPSFEGNSNASTNSSDIMVSHEAAQGKPSFEGNSNASTNSSDIVPNRKSNRRRSYTSLLMASSKLLEEHGEVAGQGKLPSIDDDYNQLEVAEYVDEIYQYYWVMEAQNPLPGNYMSIQTDITPLMRGILINWLIEVHFKFELMQETLYLMVTLLDRYLSQVQIKKNEMQLVGLTALLLASKYEDFWHPRIKDLISVSAESYTRDHMLRMEKLMLKTLKFRLNVPTPYVFMLRFLKAAQSDTKLEHLAFYLIELSLIEYEALKFKPSLLCASAIYVARCTLQMTPVWTPLLGKHARYDVSQIRDCAEMILRFHKAAKKGKLKVTYEKYTKPDLSGVAAIKPLDSLPS